MEEKELFPKVSLGDELNKQKQDTKSKATSYAKQTQLLLTAGTDEEANALRVLGLDDDIRTAQRRVGNEIDREKIEEEYGLDAYTEEEIKNLCIKYDLRFLSSQYYKGELDSELAAKLNQFIKKHPEVGDSSNSFYVIASGENFDLYERNATSRKSSNPILLYQIPKEKKYVIIHQWGKGFGFFRRLRGYFFESYWNMMTVGTSFYTFILSFILGTLFGGFTGMWFQYLNFIWIVGVSVGLTAVTLAIMFNDDSDFYKRESGRVWNDRMKSRRR